MKLQDFDGLDGFLGFLDAQGWLSAFVHPELKVVITLIAKVYYSINWQSLTCVLDLVDGRQFKLSVNDVDEFLGVLNEGDITYLENVTLEVLF